ncbi:hypothetical protein PG985_005444 [Apiospora marii]|uniref:uncharacterized protein n=1 Tax=Apiospora marii TaxID=335849 RepID=UPI0031320755
METAIQLVASHLQSPWTRQRAPKGLQAAYLQAQNAPLESTARIFLDVGFSPWVAYFLATPGETHFPGRNYQTSQLEAFDKLSTETRVSAAKRVAGSSINPTTLEAINVMERSCKRQKIARQSNPSREEPVESSPTAPPETPPQSQDQINTNAAPATGSAVDENYHFSRAAPQAIANLVPSTLNYAIRRDTTADYQTAAVTMGFPRDPVKMQYCITTIDIIQKKVEYYALKLYGIEIETEGGKRYAVLAGVRIDPEHSMTFRRCRTACIKELFAMLKVVP